MIDCWNRLFCLQIAHAADCIFYLIYIFDMFYFHYTIFPSKVATVITVIYTDMTVATFEGTLHTPW